jgi:hypothetical protein
MVRFLFGGVKYESHLGVADFIAPSIAQAFEKKKSPLCGENWSNKKTAITFMLRFIFDATFPFPPNVQRSLL